MTRPAWVCVFLPGVMEYIREMRDILCDLHTRVQKAKLNVDSITQLMEVPSAGALWVPSREGPAGIHLSPAQQNSPLASSPQECAAAPLFERKDNKKSALLDLDRKANTFTKRCAAVRDAGVKVQEMVEVRGAPGRFNHGWFNRERIWRPCAAVIRTWECPPEPGAIL